MNLKILSNQNLIEGMARAVHNERKATHLVLLHILEIEKRKLYLDLGYGSIFAYLTQQWKYSEASAYTRISSARLLRQIPSVTSDIAAGSINLTQLCSLQKCLKEKQNTQRPQIGEEEKVFTLNVIEQLKNKNGSETKRILAETFDLPLREPEVLRPQKDKSVRLEITLNAEQFSELELAKSLASHSCPTGKWVDVITYLAKAYNKKKVGDFKFAN
jgi:hypothetical protein